MQTLTIQKQMTPGEILMLFKPPFTPECIELHVGLCTDERCYANSTWFK